MKILVIVEICSLGGHVVSAIDTAQELRKRGHKGAFAGSRVPMEETLKAEFPFYRLNYPYFLGTHDRLISLYVQVIR